MKKRTIALVLSTMMVVSLLASCGDKPTTPTPAAGDGTSIKVGILAPLTGNAAQYGIAARDGAQLYIDEVNAKGGINGKQIETIVLDEKGAAADAVIAYTNMVGQGVAGIVGDVTTAPSVAVADQSVADNMPVISGTATGASLTEKSDGAIRGNVFRACFIDPFQGEKMAAFANEKLSAKTAAIIYNTSTDYSTGLKDAFVAKAAEIGLEVVDIQGYADADVDFMSQLTNIAAKNPDVLFCPDYYQKTSLIAPQARDNGIEATLIGGDGWDGIVEAMSDTSSVEGVYFCSGFSKDDTSDTVQNFVKAFTEKYNTEPSMFAAQSYDAARILCDGLIAAEASGNAVGTPEYKQATIDAMKATDADFVTGHMTYDEKNNPTKEAVIITVKDGKYAFDQKF